MPPPKRRTRPAPAATIKYTINLPPEIYALLSAEAEKKKVSMRDVVIRAIEKTLLK